MACPTDTTGASGAPTWLLDAENLGCCPQGNYLSTAAAGQWACCPCGTACAGLPPAPFQEWSFNGTYSGSHFAAPF
jgi:hypothetical protein